ncbi:microsomal triglyceride transfer protein large subunit-like isoform X2 [Babylonia areolata]|uniref:microsomal triglyceride transfer protein large subunit-like isoform X2 n=1 Tax=Babylonia areolata TaxID=304850 RepID=UPI003FD55B45
MAYWCIRLALCVLFFAYNDGLQFKMGNVYQYSYTTSTLFNEVNTEANTSGTATTQKDVGVSLALTFDIVPLMVSDSQFLKLKVTSARFTSATRPAEERELNFMLKYPAYFELTADTIERVYVVDGDPVFSTNVKKGIMGLFQLRQEAGERTEIDVCGECQVSYAVMSPNSVSKTKVSCQNMEIAGQFSTPNKILGLSVWNKATMHYELKDGVVNRATGTTRLVSYLNLRTSLNGGVISSQKVSLENTAKQDIAASSSVDNAVTQAEKETGRSLLMTLLPSENELQECTDNCKSPREEVGQFHDDLLKEKLATLDSAKAFVKVLRSFRNAGKQTIAEILTNRDNYHILPQLIDITTATQTHSSQEALLDLLSFEDEDSVEYPERYLFAAAYSTHPSEQLIRDLLAVLEKKIPSDTLQESLLLGVASMVNTLCQAGDQCQQQVVKDVQQLLVRGLEGCGEPSCQGMYLRALGNAGLGSTVKVIMTYAEKPGASMVAFTAISALRRMHQQFIDNDVKGAMLRIFHQTSGQYDSSVRVAALEVVLRNQPSPPVLKEVLLAAVDKKNFEFSTYVYNSVIDAASSDAVLRDTLRMVLKDQAVNNYNVHSHKGKSSVFTNFLAKTSDINATYSMYIENSNSGIMKKSGMDVNLLGKLLKQPFMKFGIFAEGLESLVGESEEGESTGDESTNQVEPMAGMTFTLMDVLLRQIEFFRGSSGLMSAVWNAPSELTSALQGNLLLQDHSQRVHLSNGLVVSVEVMGALSMDLSGLVSISLWNRNCEALIRNSGALYIEGTMKLDSSLVESGLVFSGEGQSAIDFTTDADFYEMPLKLCMQMIRPQFTFKQSVMKYEALKSVNRLWRKATTTTTIPAESYFLNEANSAECRLMKSEG